MDLESGWENAWPWLSVIFFSKAVVDFKLMSPAPIDLHVVTIT